MADKLPRCGAIRPDAPDMPCIRAPHHPASHVDLDGTSWDDEAGKRVADKLPAPLPSPDTTEAEHILLAVLVYRLGGRVVITESELLWMRQHLTLLDARRNPLAFEWTIEARVDPHGLLTIELHKPDSEI